MSGFERLKPRCIVGDKPTANLIRNVFWREMEVHRLRLGSVIGRRDQMEHAYHEYSKMEGLADFGASIGILEMYKKDMLFDELRDILNFGGAIPPFYKILGEGYDGDVIGN